VYEGGNNTKAGMARLMASLSTTISTVVTPLGWDSMVGVFAADQHVATARRRRTHEQQIAGKPCKLEDNEDKWVLNSSREKARRSCFRFWPGRSLAILAAFLDELNGERMIRKITFKGGTFENNGQCQGVIVVGEVGDQFAATTHGVRVANCLF
jgi:hypothetical protein